MFVTILLETPFICLFPSPCAHYFSYGLCLYLILNMISEPAIIFMEVLDAISCSIVESYSFMP